MHSVPAVIVWIKKSAQRESEVEEVSLETVFMKCFGLCMC